MRSNYCVFVAFARFETANFKRRFLPAIGEPTRRHRRISWIDPREFARLAASHLVSIVALPLEDGYELNVGAEKEADNCPPSFHSAVKTSPTTICFSSSRTADLKNESALRD
jgi:hypothetical protein